jgi:ribonuclease HI
MLRASNVTAPEVLIYTDGGARGNPGPAGAGAVICDGVRKVAEISKYLGRQTNNWAEYEAVALALKKAKQLGFTKRKIEVRLDSQLVTEQLSNNWQIKEETLFPQFIKVHNMLVADFSDIRFVYVPREKNKEADALANKAMDNK